MKHADLEALLATASHDQRRTTRLAIFYAAVATICGVALLGLAGWFITAAALAGAAGLAAVQTFNYLLPSAAIRLLAIIRTAARYGERLQGHWAALATLATIRAALFDRFIRAPDMARNVGDFAAALLQDVEALEDRFIRAPGQAGAIAGGLAALAFIAIAGPLAVVAFVLMLASLVGIARALARRFVPKSAHQVQTKSAELKQALVDYSACSAEILAYGMRPAVEAQLQARAAALDHARTALARSEAVIAALVTVVGGLAMALVIGLSTASLPMTMLAGLAAAGAIEAMGSIVRSTSRDAVIAAGLARLSRLISCGGPSAEAGRRLTGARLQIGEGADAIELRAGWSLAITGPSGCGKTSLLEALTGLRDTGPLPISIDGVALDGCNRGARTALFALSSQDAAMIAGTIADNLRLARTGVDDEDMWRALTVACLSDEVRAMPDGLASWCGDAGSRLSGGQRKRLSLARALLAARPWLLLDEPSEGLDPATETRLRDNLAAWRNESGSGLVIVTHRAALLCLADKQLALGC
jgi:ATP-binding cassette subfamily C protein CydC